MDGRGGKINIIDPNAMILATSNKILSQSVRVCSLRDLIMRLHIYTNYRVKRKILVKILMLQYCSSGRNLKDKLEFPKGKLKFSKRSEEYFHSRPRESQLAAWLPIK